MKSKNVFIFLIRTYKCSLRILWNISLHEFSSFIGIILTYVAWGVKVGMEKMSLYLHPLLTLCSLEEDAA